MRRQLAAALALALTAFALPPQEVVDGLLAWGAQRGIVHSMLLRATSFGAGEATTLGVVAARDIRRGESIVHVPHAVTLTGDSARASPEVAGAVGWLGPHFVDRDALVLFVAHELHRWQSGDTCSPLHPYVAYLAAVELTTPVYWPEAEWAAAEPELRSLAARSVHHIHLLLEAVRRRLRLAPGGVPAWLTERGFVRAHQLVTTRHWKPALMVPLADMANHGRSKSPRLVEGAAGIDLVASADHAAGEPITYYYGDHTPDEMRVFYGCHAA